MGIKCKYCNKEYDLAETHRVYGLALWTMEYCSAQCYTKSATKEKP